MTSIWKLRLKLVLLSIGSFLITIAPLAVVFILKWEDYTTTPNATIKLTMGGMMAAVFLALLAFGKLKMPRKIVLLSVLLVIVYLLQAMLNDLVLILGMSLGGEVLDLILFQYPLKRTREQILIGKGANATTAQVEAVIQKYVGNGRV